MSKHVTNFVHRAPGKRLRSLGFGLGPLASRMCNTVTLKNSPRSFQRSQSSVVEGPAVLSKNKT